MTSHSVEKTLIIPSETRTREFEPKLLLACYAVTLGFRVIVGSRVEIHNNAHKLPRGIYLSKDIRGSSNRVLTILSNLGFGIVALDEEGLLYFSDESYYQRRVSSEVLEHVSEFYAWGEDSAQLTRRAPGYSGFPVHALGNPRADICRPEYRSYYADRVEELRGKYGDYILIVSNFASLNPFYSSLKQSNGQTADQSFDLEDDWPTFRGRLYSEFLNLGPRISKALPDVNVVVRPHPGEDASLWDKAAEGVSNVYVDGDGAVTPWIMAARALVHNNCTTAVEAAMLNVPRIAYRIIKSEKHEAEITNKVSHEVDNFDELIKSLKEIPQSVGLPEGMDSSAMEFLSPLISGLTGKPSFETIADCIDQHSQRILANAGQKGKLDELSAYVHSRLRSNLKQVKSKFRGNKNSQAYTDMRFPVLQQADVERYIATIRDVANLDLEIKSEQLFKNVFVLSGNQTS